MKNTIRVLAVFLMLMCLVVSGCGKAQEPPPSPSPVPAPPRVIDPPVSSSLKAGTIQIISFTSGDYPVANDRANVWLEKNAERMEVLQVMQSQNRHYLTVTVAYKVK